MKDFFANLIERHEGRAETVTPRASAYFEEESNSVTVEAVDLVQPQ